MKSAVETLSPTRVKLTVEVPFEDLAPSMDAAYRDLAKQVRVPGFRPGKAPARMIDNLVGRGAVLERAVNDALPKMYGQALDDGKLRAIGEPEVEVTGFGDGEPLLFTAEVDVRPEIELPDYDGIEVSVDDVDVTDADVDTQLDAQRDRFATLTSVERPAAEGDYLTLDIATTSDGEPVEGASAKGMSYEVGTEGLLDGLDAAVTGVAASGTATFTTTLGTGDDAKQVDVTVTVSAVRAKDLPALDDDFAQQASEFDTLDELRDSVRTRLERVKRMEQAGHARDKVLVEFFSRAEVPLPPHAVETEIASRIESYDQQLAAYGMNRPDFLTSEGKSQEDWEAEIRSGVEHDMKAQFMLDLVAAKEEFGVDEAELTQYLVHHANRVGMSPDDYAQRIVDADRVPSVVADLLRTKATATLLERAVITDASGNRIDLDKLQEEAAEEAARTPAGGSA